jgi:NAD(P)-dependent dehydrogenase (short-subunit alcohol dehydrogenase family)
VAQIYKAVARQVAVMHHVRRHALAIVAHGNVHAVGIMADQHLDQLRPLDDETVDRWLAMLRVNVVAAAALNRACRPLLQAAPSASVVMTIESHALSPSMFWGSFALSKQALLSLVAVQAQEWRVFGNLRINALLPGPVSSPQRNRTHPAEDASTLPAPEAVATGYLYLLDPDTTVTSGSLLDLRADAPATGMAAA